VHKRKASNALVRWYSLISAEECPTQSPDVNPVDYSVWDILKELVHEELGEPHANLSLYELKNAIRQKNKRDRLPSYKRRPFCSE